MLPQLSENEKSPFRCVNAAPPVTKNSQLLLAKPRRPRAVASQSVLTDEAIVNVAGAQHG